MILCYSNLSQLFSYFPIFWSSTNVFCHDTPTKSVWKRLGKNPSEMSSRGMLFLRMGSMHGSWYCYIVLGRNLSCIDTFLAEFVFSKVWSLRKGTTHWLVSLWKQFVHIIVVCRLIYRTVKSRCANLIPLMIYGLLKWMQQFCHPVFGHIFHFMP